MPPFLVLGANGLVGTELRELARQRGLHVAFADRLSCDIRSEESIRQMLERTRPEVAINCAAYNAVDKAESEPDEALRINRDGAAAVARLAPAIIHYSSDFVFDGTKTTPYTEADPVHPLSAYAHSKAEGDRAVAASNPKHFILRVGCLYGAAGRGFGSTLLRKLQDGVRVKADGDRQVQPTWGGSVAQQTLALVSTGYYGLFHSMCHGSTTWAEFAREFARLAGYSTALIDAVPTSSFSAPAQRPQYGVLDNVALRALGLDLMPTWQVALQGYLSQVLGGST